MTSEPSVSSRVPVLFLNRAYNDLDTQAPLIAAFAEDPRYETTLFGFVCDGECAVPEGHEAVAYLRDRLKVRVTTQLDLDVTPWRLRVLQALRRGLVSRRRKPGCGHVAGFLLRKGEALCARLLRWAQARNGAWVERWQPPWHGGIVIIDEVVAATERSPFLRSVLPRLTAQGNTVVSILAGNNCFLDAQPDACQGDSPAPLYDSGPAKVMFVPNRRYVDQAAHQYPTLTMLPVGHMRCEEGWLNRLSAEALRAPHYDAAAWRSRLPAGGARIVMMMSKLHYGIDPGTLNDAIRRLATVNNVSLVIKPHTRGMKLDFLSPSDRGRVMDGTDIPSAVLVDWAELVLVQGSSIGLHPIAQGKAVGQMKFCQRLPTAFDDPAVNLVFETVEELVGLAPSLSARACAAAMPGRAAFIEEEIYAAAPDRQVSQRVKAIIERLHAGETPARLKDELAALHARLRPAAAAGAP